MADATTQPAAGQTTGSFLDQVASAPQAQQPAPAAQPNGQAPAAGDRPEWAVEKFWKEGKVDVEGMSQSYKSLETYLGGEKAPVVKNWEDKEAVERWYKAAGRPDDPNGYEFSKPEKLPTGFYDDTAEKSFRDWAHNNGLNKHQAANLHDAFVKTQLEKHTQWEEQQRQQAGKVKAELIREHGAGYEAFEKAASAALNRYADPVFLARMRELGLDNDPAVVRVFGNVGKSMMGETALRGQPKVEVNTKDLDRQIADFRDKHGKDDRGKVGGPLHDRSHPDHRQRVEEFSKLFALRFPEEQQ